MLGFRYLTPLGKLILLVIVLVVLAIGGGFYWLNTYIYQEKQGPTDYKDATYIIGGTPITLVDGVSEIAQAGSVSKIITKYFGNQAKGDLNGDGIPDLAFLLTQEGGGSGTFYYLVGAIQTTNNTYNGTHAVLIGDRIAPQTTEFRDGLVIVNYAERLVDEPMSTQPSVGKSLYLKLDPETMQWGEVVQDFEGEADPSKMTLDMKTWAWIFALFNDERKVAPKKTGDFTITFEKDGKFTATTDCNAMFGEYKTDESTIAFSAIGMTRKFCEGSQEVEFSELLTNSSGYHFTSKGELILDLKFDSGSVIFR